MTSTPRSASSTIIRLLATASALGFALGIIAGLVPIGMPMSSYQIISCGSAFLPSEDGLHATSFGSALGAEVTCEGRLGTRRTFAVVALFAATALATAAVATQIWTRTTVPADPAAGVEPK